MWAQGRYRSRRCGVREGDWRPGGVRGQVCEGAGAGSGIAKRRQLGRPRRLARAGANGQGAAIEQGRGREVPRLGCVCQRMSAVMKFEWKGGASAAAAVDAWRPGRGRGRGPSAGVRQWDGSVEESDREVGRLLDRSGGVARSNGFVPGDRDA